MDEDAGVKAPVTRLRRRTPVEKSEENKSPALNTPTKKRGGRKTAKPELGLIDENTPDNTNTSNTTRRTTKKTATTDVVVPEEKPVTPARRSTRVRSNTSILSETALVIDSPRARRAARRASVAGSDSDAPLTPIRQTRRTRKDSASSVENEPQLPQKQGIQITEVIIEEPEIKSTPQSETTTDQDNTPNNIRKSPRLLDKKKSSPDKISVEAHSNDTPLTETSKNTPTKTDTPTFSSDPTNLSAHDTETNDSKNGMDTSASNNQTETSQKRLSIASAKLIKELNTVVTYKPYLNKSCSDTENKGMNSKRHRTKSWTTLSASNDSHFHSDNESSKSKIKPIKSFTPLVLRYKCGSGDRSLNTSLNHDVSLKSMSKRKKKDSMNFVVEDIDNIERGPQNETPSLDQNSTAKIFENEPCGDIKTTIFIEDIDSNSEKIGSQTRQETEDQCVPVINHLEVNSFISITDKNEPNVLIKSTELSQKRDIEPMDIDETIPESIIIQSPEPITTGRKSTSIHISNLSSGETEINKSERKSSITQSLDKSGIETKTTLILSQIKDSSAGDEVKSPHTVKNKLLSKSVDDLNITQENEIKKNISLHYSTSTPLQDKNIQKFKGILVNTPISDTQNNDNKNTTNEEPDVCKDQCNNISQTENNDLSEQFNLKEPKNKRKGKKSYKEIEISHTEVKELKEKMDADNVTLNENRSTVKDVVLVTVKQNNESKQEDESDTIKFNKSQSKVKQSKKNLSSSEESEEEIESSDDSKNKNNFIDDEAVDAGDDYESGDSQNESEQQYEKENEVLDKGETLTTDEEFSDDSDYEKDSFIVSSNEEDEDLLDGTDDDLSMSDNELKMTAKSKKKYNERKGKEQKEASREMFESRHKLNTAKKSSDKEITTAKTNKRQQISSSESEEDIKPKKNNRLRLDSTKEASLIADKSEHEISMKKNKQLLDSDSSSCENVANEIEMTVCNESIKESDPLSAQIKTEPKTPQRSANSTIAFIDSEEVNNDQIDKNESTKTRSEFLDPLQATMLADDDEDSLSSDNENIIQNYDSVLKDLNETNKIKAKVCDISLNLVNNRKKKQKATIIDKLNLTVLKSDRKPENKKKAVCRDEDEPSSDSIDFHLLFSEHSNNSDTSSLQNKTKVANTNSEEIIPLKRTEAKTDIRESKDEGASFFFDTVGSHADSVNKSNDLGPKTDKKLSTENIDVGASFFFDTVGSHADSMNKSNDLGSKKDKKHSTENIDFEMEMIYVNKSINKIPDKDISDDEAPTEIYYQKEKTPKRKSKSQDDLDIVIDQTDNNQDILIEPNSRQKKKHNKSASNSLVVDDLIPPMPDINQEVPTESKTSQKKKLKKSASNSVDDDITPSIPDDQHVSIESENTQKKKCKKPASFLSISDNQEVPTDMKTSQKKKRNKSASNSLAEDDVPPSVSDNEEVPIEISTSQKKKHNKSTSNSLAVDDVIPSVPDNNQEVPTESMTSLKKKLKKSASNSVNDITPSIPDDQDVPIESEIIQKKKCKKHGSFSVDDVTPSISVENAETSTKKRKRKPSPNTTKEEILPADNVETSKELNESLGGSKKKKRKIATQGEIETVADTVPIAEEREEQSCHKKRDKKKQAAIDVQNSSKDIDKRNKKRKERDDDKTSTSKLVKEVIFEKVPRLPPALLEKLDDVPHIERPSKKPKLASTTQFLVDDIKKRKVKPSDYLEESVYLNEDSEHRKNRKDRLLKPKVLPFVPTASTSSSGFTTDFKITVLPSNITFVAQASTVDNFRERHLYGHKIRRPGTSDTYRRQRNRNLTKF